MRRAPSAAGRIAAAPAPPAGEAADGAPLLGPADPPPCVVVNGAAASPVVLACDHAGNAVPRALAGLGLPPSELERHIAWDNGAADVARRLASRLDACCVMAGYSRLVIDCNRMPGHETSIPVESDGTRVPGNAALGPQDRARRRAAVFAPYHRALAERLEAVRAGGRRPVLLAIHSFTPVLDGVARPWQVAVLWGRDDTVPAPLLSALRARGDLTVGDNQPYSGREHYGYTMNVHGVGGGIPHALIEIRSDLIADPDGVDRYAAIVGEAIETALLRIGSDPGETAP